MHTSGRAARLRSFDVPILLTNEYGVKTSLLREVARSAGGFWEIELQTKWWARHTPLPTLAFLIWSFHLSLLTSHLIITYAQRKIGRANEVYPLKKNQSVGQGY